MLKRFYLLLICSFLCVFNTKTSEIVLDVTKFQNFTTALLKSLEDERVCLPKTGKQVSIKQIAISDIITEFHKVFKTKNTQGNFTINKEQFCQILKDNDFLYGETYAILSSLEAQDYNYLCRVVLLLCDFILNTKSTATTRASLSSMLSGPIIPDFNSNKKDNSNHKTDIKKIFDPLTGQTHILDKSKREKEEVKDPLKIIEGYVKTDDLDNLAEANLNFNNVDHINHQHPISFDEVSKLFKQKEEPLASTTEEAAKDKDEADMALAIAMSLGQI